MGQSMEKEKQLKTFEILNEISKTAMLLENAVLDVADIEDMSAQFCNEAERVLRDLRYIANAITATHTLNKELTRAELEEIGVIASVGDSYIEIELPYDVVTKSAKYHVLSKKVVSSAMISNIRREWRSVMRRTIYEMGKLPFGTPLQIADISVFVLSPTKRERDPDHFWFRPLLDALVSSGVLIEDYSSNVNLTFHYGLNKENPGVIIQVRPSQEHAIPSFRGANLSMKIGG